MKAREVRARLTSARILGSVPARMTPKAPSDCGRLAPSFALSFTPMKTKPYLTAEDVRRIGDAAVAEASKNGWAVTVAVVDDGGHLLWLQRLDGAAPISAQIAPAKARTAALGRRESRVYEEMINQGRQSFLSAPLEGMLEGGVPLLVDGQCIGAVGVSGVKSSEDAQIARAGIAALTS